MSNENKMRYRVVFAPKKDRWDGVVAVHVYVFAEDTEDAINTARKLGFEADEKLVEGEATQAWSVHRAMPDKE